MIAENFLKPGGGGEKKRYPGPGGTEKSQQSQQSRPKPRQL